MDNLFLKVMGRSLKAEGEEERKKFSLWSLCNSEFPPISIDISGAKRESVDVPGYSYKRGQRIKTKKGHG